MEQGNNPGGPEKKVNPKEVKGVDTVASEKKSSLIPEYNKNLNFEKPKDFKEASLGDLVGVSGMRRSADITTHNHEFINPKVNELYGTLNLTDGIPNPTERAAAKERYGDKLIKTFDEGVYKIRFNDEISDYAAYREKDYHKRVNKFLDDLDESQGFLESTGQTVTALVGHTLLSVGGILPVIYGAGAALLTWDKSKLFNNNLMNAWEDMTQDLNKSTVVFGGSQYYNDAQGNQKGFGARFIHNPIKSLNEDVAPAVGFIAGAVGTTALSTALAPFTGGSSLVANTANLAARATMLFGRASSSFAKGVKALRGIGTVPGITQVDDLAKLAKYQSKFQQGIGTINNALLGGSYESALMAKSTYDATYEKFLETHKEINGRDATDAERSIYKRKAEDAGFLSWSLNMPLVGASNLIQFSKIFNIGYATEKSIVNADKLAGISKKAGVWEANVDKLSRLEKVGILTAKNLKKAASEGFEEFAQGVIEEANSNYYSAKYTKNSLDFATNYFNHVSKAAKNQFNTVEGRDSMTIGFIMGLVGIRLPMAIDSKTGKVSFGISHLFSSKGGYGGISESIGEYKEGRDRAREAAKFLNENPSDEVLKANFQNSLRVATNNLRKQKAIKDGDVFTYKNTEFEDLHSLVEARHKAGLVGTIYQDLDAAEKLTLEQFNAQYSTPEILEFTEESRKEAINKARKKVQTSEKAIKDVEAILQRDSTYVDSFFKNTKDLVKHPELHQDIFRSLVDQLAFLKARAENLKERETVLAGQLNEMVSGNSFGPMGLFSTKILGTTDLEEVATTITGTDSKGKVSFISQKEEFIKEALKEWAEKDPIGFSFHKKEGKKLLEDLINIKEAKSQTATLFSTLFTNKGAEKFAKLTAEAEEIFVENLLEKIKEQKDKEANSAMTGTRANHIKKDAESIGDNELKSKTEASELSSIEEQLLQEAVQGGSGSLNALMDALPINATLESLRTRPFLYNLIKEQLEEEGVAIPANFEELKEYLADPENMDSSTIKFQILKKLKEILENYQNNKPLGNPNFKDTSKENEVFIDPTEASPTVDRLDELASLINELTDQFKKGEVVNETSFIGLTFDKEMVGGKPVRNENGSFKSLNVQTETKFDTQLINSPDFHPNKKLKERQTFGELRIIENSIEKSLDPASEEYVHKVPIGIYDAENNLLALVPVYSKSKNLPSHLLALRNQVVGHHFHSGFDGSWDGSSQTTTSNQDTIVDKKAKIKTEISELERRREEEIEKQNLLNQPSQESEVKEVIPAKVDTYLSSPNQDGSFNSSSSKTSFIPGASIMAFESIGNNKFAVYISKNEDAVKLALQYPDKTIDPVFEGASYFNPKAKEIQVIKPAIVELQGDKYVLIEKGLIDYDNAGINKSKVTKSLPDTFNIDAQIAQKQAELAALEGATQTNSTDIETEAIDSIIDKYVQQIAMQAGIKMDCK